MTNTNEGGEKMGGLSSQPCGLGREATAAITEAEPSAVRGSRLYLQYVEPDERFDGINRRVWSGTPWITSAFTDSYSAEPDRRRRMNDWCSERLGPPAFPFGDKPRAGRWREGNATVFGWTWFGFSTEAEMREFEAAWPSPVDGGASHQPTPDPPTDQAAAPTER